jgi:hypothetical protein
MPVQFTIELGKKHFLFQEGETEGARCAFMPEGEAPLVLAVFVPNPTTEELRPSRIRLGLSVYHQSVFLILNIDDSYCDMPYWGVPAQTGQKPQVAPAPAGYGIACCLAICNEHGICRSMAVRNLTNRFSNAFIDAVNQQIACGFAIQQHEQAVRSAYATWRNS